MTAIFGGIILLNIIVNTGIAIIIPVMPLFLKEFGFSTIGLSLPFLMLAIGRFTSMLSSSKLLAYFGSKYVLATCFLIITTTFMLYPIFHSPTSLMLLRFFEGVAEGTAIVVLTNLAIIHSKKHRGCLMGLFSASFGIGFLLGPILGGIVYSQFGTFSVFYTTAIMGSIGFLVCLKLFGNNSDTDAKQITKKINLWDNIHYLPLFRFYFPIMMRRVVFIGLIIMLPLFTVSELALDIVWVSIFFTISAVIIIVLTPFTGRFIEKKSAFTIAYLSLISMGLLIIAFGLYHSLEIFLVLFILETIAFAFMMPAGMKLFADIVEVHPHRETILGTFAACTELITLFVVILIPLLYAISPTLAWGILGMSCIGSAVALIKKRPYSPLVKQPLTRSQQQPYA